MNKVDILAIRILKAEIKILHKMIALVGMADVRSFGEAGAQVQHLPAAVRRRTISLRNLGERVDVARRLGHVCEIRALRERRHRRMDYACAWRRRTARSAALEQCIGVRHPQGRQLHRRHWHLPDQVPQGVGVQGRRGKSSPCLELVLVTYYTGEGSIS